MNPLELSFRILRTYFSKEEYFGGGFNILAIKPHRSHKTLRIIRSIFWKVLNRNIEVGTLKKYNNKKTLTLLLWVIAPVYVKYKKLWILHILAQKLPTSVDL